MGEQRANIFDYLPIPSISDDPAGFESKVETADLLIADNTY